MNKIEVLRKKASITQAELAEKMGTTQGAISQWEGGKAAPTADKLPQLAKILGCTIDDLFEN